MKNSQELQQNILPQIIHDSSISVYFDILTTKTIIEQVARLKQAFPSLHCGFYDILMERIRDNRFTDNRLIDAISNLIDTCRYPAPVIADIISWDKRIKLYTHHEMSEMAYQYVGKIFEEYKAVVVAGSQKRLYASVKDIELYKLKML